MKVFTLFLLGLLAAAPAAADERGEHEQVLRGVEQELQAGQRELSRALAQLGHAGDMHHADRAFLGIALEDDEGVDGVRVKGVTPEGPAQKAGLKAGDVITSLNGKSLAGDGPGSPARKLVEEMKSIKPGAEVRVEYMREGKVQSASVTTGKFPHHVTWMGLHGGHPSLPWHGSMHHAGGFGELELTALNPDLGAYFGATSGVLVVQGPGSETLPLKGGDVILRIGERVPSSPSQTWRILSSYDSGEKIPVTILRQRKEQVVTITHR